MPQQLLFCVLFILQLFIFKHGLCDPLLPYSDVFLKASEGYQCYRVPSMIATSKGTLIALAEGRKVVPTPDTCSSDGGETNKDIVLKRSTDGGNTWGSLQVIASVSCKGSFECGYPTAVQDNTTGGGLFVSTSADDGATWSSSTTLVLPSMFTSASPGHGIQIDPNLCGTQGPDCPAGRLLVPMWCSSSAVYACSIYSDDSGKTWKAGYVDTPQPGSRETQFAQLPSTGAKIYSNSRNFAGTTRGTRFIAISEDGGSNFTNFYQDKALVEPVTPNWTGIVAGLQALTNTPSRLLFSDADCATARMNMTIKLSYDGGNTWAKSRTLDPGPSAYSVLSKLSDTQAGILYERGSQLEYYEKITFVQLPLSWLEGN